MNFNELKQTAEQGQEIAIANGLAITEADYFVNYQNGTKGLNENGLKKLAILRDMLGGCDEKS